MIKSLKLWNFQAHRSLEIEFPPGITTIKGPTDVGKSSVLRALRWLCLNDIGGEEFISWGQTEVVAQLVLDGGRVARRKGKENIYKLNGKIFRAIGAGQVPTPIVAVLGLNEINFQRQMDAHFWLASSAPEVSRQLNRVIDLSVIDESLAKAGAFVRSARERVVVTEERLEEKRIALETARLGVKRIQAFKVISVKYERADKVRREHDGLQGIMTQLDAYQREELESRATQMAAILDQAGRLWKVERELRALRLLQQQLDQAKAKSLPLPDLAPVRAAWLKCRQVETERDGLARWDLFYALALTQVRSQEAIYNQVRAELAKVACPVCGRKNL